VLENIKNIRTMDFKGQGDKILLIGETYDELGGSEYLRTIYDIEEGCAPKVRVDEEVANGQTVLDIIDGDGDKNYNCCS
jgi:Phosphoribosylformylglycinamidine (FGAM) synthase, synthetase domain